MCASCGCQSDATTTLLNLQTGAITEIAPVNERDDDARPLHVHGSGTHHHHAHNHSHVHGHAGHTAHHEHDHTHPHDHGLDDRHRHVRGDEADKHSHDEPHDHRHAPPGQLLDIEKRILAKNDALAAKSRAWLSGREILALNLVSSPGSGKTTLLERTIARLAGELSLFVIEGDQATANDGERIRAAGAPVVQVNTGTGCHLDAEMVARGLSELRPEPGAVVFIENVGNLVCPALFDLGERAKVVIFSATEGEDKPLKYPHMFRVAPLVILNKTDLLPHLDFSVEWAVANVRLVNPDAVMLHVSARSGEGLEAWFDWVRAQAMAARQFAFA